MILYKKGMAKYKKDRPGRELKISIDELPKNPSYIFRTAKEKVKFIKSVEATCRKSFEYKELVKFLKRNTNLKRCVVLQGLNCENGKRYTIEIHHEPFTLFDIAETVINRREAESESLDPMDIADEIMELHYAGKIGLIHLSKTMHQLVHDDKIFIPLQYVYQQYDEFYTEYRRWMNPILEQKIEAKADLSMKTDSIVSDAIDPIFTYLDVDGFEFPQIPEEWKTIMHMEASPNEETENSIVVAADDVVA